MKKEDILESIAAMLIAAPALGHGHTLNVRQSEIFAESLTAQYDFVFGQEDDPLHTDVGHTNVAFFTLAQYDRATGLTFYFSWTGGVSEPVHVNTSGFGEATRWLFMPSQHDLLSFAIPLPLASAWFRTQCVDYIERLTDITSKFDG
jgi:hypothetical protein